VLARHREADERDPGRIANAKAAGDNPSEKGGRSPAYEDWTKDELIAALRNH
jgi:hypothetical protein